MFRYLFTICIICLFCKYSICQIVKYKEAHAYAENQKDEHGNKQGIWFEFDHQLMQDDMYEICNYKDGQRDGLYILYQKFNPRIICQYSHGKIEGWVIEFSKKGKIIRQTQFLSDKKHGKSIQFSKKGKVKLIELYIDDELKSTLFQKGKGNVPN